MEKPAPTTLPLHPLLTQRWSPRVFGEGPVSASALRAVLEAARWSPSCFNDQPWRFIVAVKADDPETYARLGACLTSFNQTWALAAPVLLASIATPTFRLNGHPNRWAQHDVGLATSMLLVEAQNQGLTCHPMGGFDPDKLRAEFAVPDGHMPMAFRPPNCRRP